MCAHLHEGDRIDEGHEHRMAVVVDGVRHREPGRAERLHECILLCSS